MTLARRLIAIVEVSDDAESCLSLAKDLVARGADEIWLKAGENVPQVRFQRTISQMLLSVFVPVVGLCRSGGDRIAVDVSELNSFDPLQQIRAIAEEMGQDSLSALVPVSKTETGMWELVVRPGYMGTGLDVIGMVFGLVKAGVQEVILDGAVDTGLLNLFYGNLPVPLVTLCGQADEEHVLQMFLSGADAVAFYQTAYLESDFFANTKSLLVKNGFPTRLT